jgi:putative transposase
MIQIYPTPEQRSQLNNMLDVSNYTYNKAIAAVNSGNSPNFYALRTKIVTSQTQTGDNEYQQIMASIKELMQQKKKASPETVTILEGQIAELRNRKKQIPFVKNESIEDWELKVPKEIRAGAVNDVAKAHKTALANLKAGNIRFFHLKFRDSTNKSCVVPKHALKNVNGVITMFPGSLKMSFAMGNRSMKKHRKLKITHDSRLIKKQHKYYLMIPVSSDKQEQIKQPVNYVGVDPGVRTFMTAFGNNGCMEYEHDNSVFTKLNNKLYNLKARKKRTRKRTLDKIDARKANLINDLHWKTITHLLEHNDVIVYGDIKSHDIVSGGRNKTLNRNMNNLKFFQFKQRLLHKAAERGKRIICITEEYTTKTCSFCGKLNEPKKSKIYTCNSKECIARCGDVCRIGRDVNAAKNILMKGLLK